MARGLAAAGAKVVVAGRNAQKSAAAAKEIGGIAIEVDVLKEADCRALAQKTVAQLGRLDILVNNCVMLSSRSASPGMGSKRG